MGSDSTLGENNFNPEKMTQLELTYIKKLKAFNDYLLKYSGSSMRIENFKREIDELEKTECLINKSNKITDDTVSAILSHCKTNMRIHRDRWLDEELPDFVRGEHKGKYFAYKDIADGIRNGYFETKTDENLK